MNAVLPSVIETEMLDALAGSPEARSRMQNVEKISWIGDYELSETAPHGTAPSRHFQPSSH